MLEALAGVDEAAAQGQDFGDWEGSAQGERPDPYQHQGFKGNPINFMDPTRAAHSDTVAGHLDTQLTTAYHDSLESYHDDFIGNAPAGHGKHAEPADKAPYPKW